MTTAKTYEEIKALLEEHGCDVFVAKSLDDHVSILSVKATHGNTAELRFYDGEIFSVVLKHESERISRIAGIDHVQLMCDCLRLFNDRGLGFGIVAVEASI